MKEIEDAVWNRAVASGSVESAVAYMKQYPSGRYFEEARRTAERGSMELAEATETVRETEDSIIQLLREGNLRDHFVITTIKPQSTAFSWFRGTLKEVVTPDGPFASEIVYVREFPADPEALHPTGGPWKVFHGIIEDRRGGRLTFGEKGLPQEFFTSKNAIHRYDGRVEREDGYTFIGEGDKWNRLTFAVLDTGYVYVRGIGRVVLPDGKEVTLGGPAAQPPKKK